MKGKHILKNLFIYILLFLTICIIIIFGFFSMSTYKQQIIQNKVHKDAMHVYSAIKNNEFANRLEGENININTIIEPTKSVDGVNLFLEGQNLRCGTKEYNFLNDYAKETWQITLHTRQTTILENIVDDYYYKFINNRLVKKYRI